MKITESLSPKEKIAIRVAAKHPTDIAAAVWAFMSEAGYVDTLHSKEESIKMFNDAQEELFSLLPAYRWPVADIFAEALIFFNQSPACSATGYSLPNYYEELRKLDSVPENILADVRADIEKLAMTKVELQETKRQRDELLSECKKAEKEYLPQSDNERISKREHRVIVALGLTKGKRQKTYDEDQMFRRYIWLVRHKGLYQDIAILKLQENYDLSEQTVIKALFRVSNKIKKSHQEQNPEFFSKIEHYFKGLVPQFGDRQL